jgi:hypothetical protein
LTDSKRTTQASARLAFGSSKSLRYQPIEPAIDAFDGSPRFHTFGTVTGFQPSDPVWRMKRCLIPSSAKSSRNSHWPSIRKRPSGPSW